MKYELYHHGVKGMRWGVRRWQNKDGSLTSAGKARRKNWTGGETYGRDLKRYTSMDLEYAKATALSVALLPAMLFIPGLAHLSLAKSLMDFRKNHLDGRTDYTKKEGDYEKLSDLKKKTSPSDPEIDVKQTNPRIGNQKGKVNNCTLCTAAMELRNRGYDVIARSKGSGNIEDIYSKWFKGAKVENVDVPRNSRESRKSWANRSYSKFCDELEKQGPGASGYVGLRWDRMGSGHAMWYKVGNDGEVVFYDGQTGKYGVNTDKYFAMADPSRRSYCRLDNCELDPSVTESVRSNPKGGK